ncbi:ABC transporter substrate-binding protein [Anaerosporobacter sp.]
MKKSSKVIALLLAMVFLITGCTKKNDTNTSDLKDNVESTQTPDSESVEKTVLRLGMIASTDAIPFVLIEKNGLDDKYNLDLQFEVFKSAKDRDAALQAGELDGFLADLIAVCIYQNANLDVKITGSTDGDFVLLASKNSGITDVSQIKGKSISISENTLIDYTLDKILESNNLESDDVKKEIVDRIPDRFELLRNDKIDLGLMPEPFASLALEDGAINLGSASEYGLYPAISAFTQTAIDEKADAIRDLYKAYNEAVDYMNNTDVSEYEDAVIEAAGYPEEMSGKIELPKFRTNELPSKEGIEAAIAWASEKGLCSSSLTYDQVVFDVSE